MLFKVGQGNLDIFLDDKLADIWLSPEEGERASYLRVRVELRALILGPFPDHDLFKLYKVGHVALLVDAAMQKPRTTTFTTSPSDQDQVELASVHLLTVNKTLHQVRAPELWHTLRLYLLEKIFVPAKTFLHMVLGSESMFFIQYALALKV